jgi:hypothetical protein
MFTTSFGHDPAQLRAVVAGAEGRIQIHQVDPLRAGVHPCAGGVERRTVIRFGAGLALAQSDGLAIANVDGREQCQCHNVFLRWLG